VVVRAGVGDREPHRHAIQERALAEVVADREDELVLAGRSLLGRTGAAVRVGGAASG
jgi:hypothetical protein